MFRSKDHSTENAAQQLHGNSNDLYELNATKPVIREPRNVVKIVTNIPDIIWK